jgi:hypothetical protein
MHPVNYLFEEIYRDYWGIPQGGKTRERKRPTLGSQLARQVRMFGSRS